MRCWLAVVGCAVVQACSPSPEPAVEGDFAVLALGATGFEQARPGVALEFPRDHGAHPGFRIEWWYLTANLEGPNGRAYGAQWTLFRTANEPPVALPPDNPWQDPQVYMAHLAITTPESHVSFQRYARGGDHGGLARAGAEAEPFVAWLDDWSLQSVGKDFLPLQLVARQGAHAVHLRLSGERAPLLQGSEGFSQKHPDGGGSYYYSQPFLIADGELEVDGQVVPVTGKAWLDREWSSQFLQPDQAGWDWLALHLDSGEKLMLFRLRGREGSGAGDYTHGVLIGPDGGKRVLDPQNIEMQVLRRERVAGRELPLHWQINLPDVGRAFEVEALHPEQWMDVDFAYWEGVVKASGEEPGNRGVGYLELTGYARE